MDLAADIVPVPRGWQLRLAVSLSRAETSELFVVGDKLVSWPTEGMLSTGRAPAERSSMFLSEIVSKPERLALSYETKELAYRAARVVAYQIRTVFAEGKPDPGRRS